MSGKNPLVVVCALAFLVGGAAAVVFTRPAFGPAAVHSAASSNTDAGHAVPEDAAESAEGDSEGARDEEAAVPEENKPTSESGVVGAEPSRTGIDVVAAEKSARGSKGRAAAAAGQTDQESRAARGYARATAGRQPSGGKGVVGYPVTGVKKTGEGVKKAGTTIGKTFGKLGGLFNE